MENKHLDKTNRLTDLEEGHVVYLFEDQNQYIQNVVDFVLLGLKKNEYTIIVDNDRFILSIKKKLSSILPERQLKMVKYINNFDFYYKKGNFRTNSILEYVPELIEDCTETGVELQAWSHVEWGNEGEIARIITESEKSSDEMVSETKILAVCAYDANRVSGPFKEGLFATHNFIMTDTDLKELKPVLK